MSWLSSFIGDLTGSNATNRAIDVQQDTADRSTELLRELYYDGVNRQQPWTNAMMDFMGIARQPANAFASGGGGGAGTADYSTYVSNHPDLQNAFNSLTPANMSHIARAGFDANGDGTIDQGEFGNFNYSTAGQAEGRSMPVFGGGTANADGTINNPNEQPKFDYTQNPLWTSMMETNQADMDNMIGAFGAGGTAMSGATLGALNDRNRQNAFNATGAIWNALNGGTVQASNQANQGNAFAGNLANIQTNLGNNMASSYLQQGQNTSRLYGNLIGSAASFL